MGGNMFRSNSTHEPTTWQNWPEAQKPCTVQLNCHLSHTVRLKPNVTQILGHVSEAQGLLSQTAHLGDWAKWGPHLGHWAKCAI